MQIESKTIIGRLKLFVCLFLIFIFGGTGPFIAAWGLAPVAARGGYSLLWFTGFSLQ